MFVFWRQESFWSDFSNTVDVECGSQKWCPSCSKSSAFLLIHLRYPQKWKTKVTKVVEGVPKNWRWLSYFFHRVAQILQAFYFSVMTIKADEGIRKRESWWPAISNSTVLRAVKNIICFSSLPYRTHFSLGFPISVQFTMEVAWKVRAVTFSVSLKAVFMCCLKKRWW